MYLVLMLAILGKIKFRKLILIKDEEVRRQADMHENLYDEVTVCPTDNAKNHQTGLALRQTF